MDGDDHVRLNIEEQAKHPLVEKGSGEPGGGVETGGGVGEAEELTVEARAMLDGGSVQKDALPQGEATALDERIDDRCLPTVIGVGTRGTVVAGHGRSRRRCGR